MSTLVVPGDGQGPPTADREATHIYTGQSPAWTVDLGNNYHGLSGLGTRGSLYLTAVLTTSIESDFLYSISLGLAWRSLGSASKDGHM